MIVEEKINSPLGHKEIFHLCIENLHRDRPHNERGWRNVAAAYPVKMDIPVFENLTSQNLATTRSMC